MYGAQTLKWHWSICSDTVIKSFDINVVAVDTDGEVMEAIQNGTNLVATVSQDPYTMGYKALENAVKYLDGEKVEDIAIECELVTADNCAEIIERNEEYLNK